MNRRNFIKTGSTAASLFAVNSTLGYTFDPMNHGKQEKHSFNLNYAPHFGMFKNSAGNDLIDQIKFMADQGFTAMEDNRMMSRDKEMQRKIGETLAKLNMTMGVFVIDKGGTLAAGKPKFMDVFLNGCRKAVDVAKRVNAKWMTVVPGGFERRLPRGIQDANVIEALRQGAEILEPHGLVMVLEPLSDSPDLYLRTSEQAYMICKAVNSPACKILYDIYHMQKNEGNLIRNIDLTWDEIAYFQIGDNPGRNEPTTGEINYKNVFKHIYNKGYNGILGMEHGKSQKGKKGERALIEAYAYVDNFKK